MSNITTNDIQENPGLAMLDAATERELYALYRNYFRDGEQNRTWNLWNDIAWDAPTPTGDLIAQVWAAYAEAAFLPDYAANALRILRGSRGRAWFVTRWSYEEGKRLLGLSEWLQKAGEIPDADLRDATDTLLDGQRFLPYYEEPLYVMLDMMLWEQRHRTQRLSLMEQARAEKQAPLLQLLDFLERDDAAQQEFLKSSLRIIAKNYRADMENALAQIAESHEANAPLDWLRSELGLAL
jgi:hypothetical protein